MITNLLLGHANALLFLAGFVAFVTGVAALKGAGVAGVVGGVVLMLVAAWPYLRPRKGLVD